MLNIGPQELLIILVIALLVVGPQRLPELGRSIGRGLRELRKAQDEVRRTIQVNLDEPNGDGGTRPKSRPAPNAAPSSGVQDPTPTAGETPSADEVREISRSLGRSLGQLRKAREEVQRSFRVDLDAPTPTPPKTSSPPAPDGDVPGDQRGAPGAEPDSDDPARG
jgi:TatA/E family protein of Tat protein translocase